MFSKYFAHSPIVVLGPLGSASYTRSIGCLSHTTLQVLQLYYLAIFKVAFDIACSCLNIQLTSTPVRNPKKEIQTNTYCHRVLTGGRTS